MLRRRGCRGEHAKTLESAFAKATSDREFAAKAKRRQLELNPIWRDEPSAYAQEIITQPAEVIERMKLITGD